MQSLVCNYVKSVTSALAQVKLDKLYFKQSTTIIIWSFHVST